MLVLRCHQVKFTRRAQVAKHNRLYRTPTRKAKEETHLAPMPQTLRETHTRLFQAVCAGQDPARGERRRQAARVVDSVVFPQRQSAAPLGILALL